MRTRIALVAFGLAILAGSGSALAQTRAIAIEPRTEVVAAPAPVAPAPVAEAPKAPAEAPVAEAPKIELASEPPKAEPPKVVVPVLPEKKIVVVKKVPHYGYGYGYGYGHRGPTCH